jgi:hypothetical protein
MTTYSITWDASVDSALGQRITAAVATEAFRNPAVYDSAYAKLVRQGPTANIAPILWAVVTAADVNDAYASALAAGNPDPGGDPAVVTDGMILANVQANWPPDPEP